MDRPKPREDMKQTTSERREEKRLIIERLTAAGVDFTKNAFCLNSDEREQLRKAAARAHYRRPAGSYFATAGAFFEHLKKYL